MPEPETHHTRGKEGHVAYQVVGDGPFDVVFIPAWNSNVDGMWDEQNARATGAWADTTTT